MKRKKELFNTIDILSNIDWSYFVLSELATNRSIPRDELKSLSIYHLNRIVRYKRKLGYNTSDDLKILNTIKSLYQEEKQTI